jgi:hypothetical protein
MHNNHSEDTTWYLLTLNLVVHTVTSRLWRVNVHARTLLTILYFFSVASYQNFGEIYYLVRLEGGGSEFLPSVRTFNFDTLLYLYDCNLYELSQWSQILSTWFGAEKFTHASLPLSWIWTRDWLSWDSKYHTLRDFSTLSISWVGGNPVITTSAYATPRLYRHIFRATI